MKRGGFDVDAVKKFMKRIKRKVKNDYACLFWFIVFVKAAVDIALYGFDIATDLEATIELYLTGQHPWWTSIMGGLIALPYLAAMGSIFNYLRRSGTLTDYKTYVYARWTNPIVQCCVAFGSTVLLILLLPCATCLADALMLVYPFLRVTGRVGRFAVFMTAYTAMRTIFESFLESPWQITLQTHIYLTCTGHGGNVTIPQCVGIDVEQEAVLFRSILTSGIGIVYKCISLYIAAQMAGTAVKTFFVELINSIEPAA